MVFPNSEYSRIQVPFLLEAVTIRTPSAVRTAISSSDLTRPADIHPDPSQSRTLPYLFRIFFSLTRFFSPIYSWFIAFLPTSHPAYDPVLSYCNERFDPPKPASEHVNLAADLLMQENVEDIKLASVFISAMFSRFSGSMDVPMDIVKKATGQVGDFGEMFLPWKFLSARKNVTEVMQYVEGILREVGDLDSLPKEAIPTVAHIFFIGVKNGPTLLKGVKNALNKEVEAVMSELAVSDKVMRVMKRDGNLGGVVDGVIKKGTVVLLELETGAREEGGWKWVFGQGDEVRRCAAEGAVREFCQEVRQELLRRTN